MKSHRRARWQIVVFTVCALVFSQMAVAAHACTFTQQAIESAQMAKAGMPCAEAMAASNDETASVCHGHCQASQATTDHWTPQVGDLSQAPAVLTVHLPSGLPNAAMAPHRSLARAAAGPPIAIAHCCFRI